MSPAFRKGLRDGIPIFLGYFSVSVAFGVQAARNGLTPAAAMVMIFRSSSSSCCMDDAVLSQRGDKKLAPKIE